MKENFKIYNFFDTDDMGFEEYDIVGKEYELLIKTCCKYCDVVSFTITNPNSKVLIELEEFKINKPDNISDDILHEYICGTEHSYFNYYRVCDKLCDILLKTTNHIFSWLNGWGYENPEDPTFYREDGSLFFTSTIHEGECTLFVRDEDVSEILANKLWIKGTGHGNHIDFQASEYFENKECFVIKESNGETLNSGVISARYDRLFTLNFYRLGKLIHLILKRNGLEKNYLIEFVDVIGFSMTSRDFGGASEEILEFEYVEPSKRVIIPKLNEECQKNSENSQRTDYNDFIETLMTFSSGDKLRIACGKISIPNWGTK